MLPVHCLSYVMNIDNRRNQYTRVKLDTSESMLAVFALQMDYDVTDRGMFNLTSHMECIYCGVDRT